MKLKLMFAVIGFATLHTSNTMALDSFLISLGKTQQQVEFMRLGISSEWDRRWNTATDWDLKGRFEVGLIAINSGHSATIEQDAASDLRGLSITPVVRLQRKPYQTSIAPFIELGIGVAYLSEHKLKNDTHRGKNLGGSWQFEDQVSAGVLFGQRQEFEASINYFHYSNANLAPPNDGLDIFATSFAYHF